MNSKEAIKEITEAPSPYILLGDDYKTKYRTLMLAVHPDRCNLPEATEAMTKLTEFYERVQNGIQFTDDSGIVISYGKKITFKGTTELLELSMRNWRMLMGLTGRDTDVLKKYMPSSFEKVNDEYVQTFDKRVVSIVDLVLPQVHVNWVLSRMLEFSLLLAGKGFSHSGISPKSIFISPVDHGIVITSYYHIVPVGAHMRTVSAEYVNWYPQNVFVEKRANHEIDLELAKRTAIHLLGDKTGHGVPLRKTVPHNIITFLLGRQGDPFQTYDFYRKLLERNFEKKFYILNI